MKYPSFNQYLNGLKPTASGVLAVSLSLIIIPIFSDLFLVSAKGHGNNEVTLSVPLINAYIKALPLYILYLFIYFIVLNIWNSIIKLFKIETFYFGS